MLLRKEKSDSKDRAASNANDNAASHETADQPTPPDTQHGKNICSFIHVGSYCTSHVRCNAAIVNVITLCTYAYTCVHVTVQLSLDVQNVKELDK